jgi:hypothetical protein
MGARSDFEAVEKSVNLGGRPSASAYDERRYASTPRHVVPSRHGLLPAIVGRATVPRSPPRWLRMESCVFRSATDHGVLASCARPSIVLGGISRFRGLRPRNGSASRPCAVAIHIVDRNCARRQTTAVPTNLLDCGGLAASARQVTFEQSGVAATGSGKDRDGGHSTTRVRQGGPSLLFVAHRGIDSRQELATFRVALHDGNFGEKQTGTGQADCRDTVFSVHPVPSSQRLRHRFKATAFEVVIWTRFHHAAADTTQPCSHTSAPGLQWG